MGPDKENNFTILLQKERNAERSAKMQMVVKCEAINGRTDGSREKGNRFHNVPRKLPVTASCITMGGDHK